MASREIRRITKKKKEEQAKQKSHLEKKKEKHPILYAGSVIIFTIIAISFIGSGLFGANGFRGTERLTFGKYDGKSIFHDQWNYFGRVYQNIANQTQNSDPASIKKIWQDAFLETVKHKAILLRAAESGYHVTEKAIDKALLKYPSYVDSDGNFDEKRYLETDRRFKDATRELVREQLTTELYRSDALYAHYYSTTEMKFFRDMVTPERAFKFVDFSLDEYPDEKVTEYGREHVADFRQIRLSRIIMGESNLADANQILDKYNSNQSSFEELAKLHSRGPFGSAGGDMGIQYYYQVRGYFDQLEDPDLMANDIFNLPENTTSAPIQVGDTWHIYRANSVAQDANLEDEETITAIREYILSQMRGEVVDYIEEEANAFKAQAAAIGFDEAATEFGRTPVGETEFFPLNYLSYYYGKSIEVKGDDPGRLGDAPDNETFFEVAFALEPEEVSEPIRLNEKIVILQLIEEKMLDDEGWALSDGYYQNYVSYQPPAFLELVNEETASYIYLFAASGYLESELDDMVIDQEKFENEFETSYAKYTAQGR